MRNILLIICDGLADRPISELQGKTPLEAAVTPNLDSLARTGLSGLMHTAGIGVRPGSDIAHLSLFGYDISKYYTGRGPFEAAGMGIRLNPGEIALRANFATVDNNMVVVDRRAGRIDDTSGFIKTLDGHVFDGITIRVVKGVGHRAVVILKGHNLDGNVTDSDPHEIGKKLLTVKAQIKSLNAKRTANVLNAFISFVYRALANHPQNKIREKNELMPANILLLRGSGVVKSIPAFYVKYGLIAACVAGAGLYKGIARVLKMDIIEVREATGKLDTNVSQKIRSAVTQLNKYDFVFVHIKACDILAEDGDYIGKKHFIEKIDRACRQLINLKNTLIVVTADHTTSSILKRHTADPVPILIHGSDINIDHVQTFSEREAAYGRLGHIEGKHLMPILIDLIGRSSLSGA